MVRRRVIVCEPLREFGCLLVHIVCLVRNAEFGENDFASAKTVRLDHVAPDIEKAGMYLFDNIGPRIEKVFRTILKIRAAPVVDRQIGRLQAHAHRTVEDDDLFF